MLTKTKFKRALCWILGVFSVWFCYQIVFLPSGKEFKAAVPNRSALMDLQEHNLLQYGVKAIKYNYVPLHRGQHEKV